ncbi:hypothetical protein [Lacrimispora xylanisolvens]
MKENTGKSKYVILGMLARMPLTGYTIKNGLKMNTVTFGRKAMDRYIPL